MPAGNEPRRATSKRLTFTGPRTFLSWLESPCGSEVRQTIEERMLPSLAGRMFDGSVEAQTVAAEVLERADKTTRAIVVVEPTENGLNWIRVYGPKELKVKIILLPMSPPVPTLESQATNERIIESEMPKGFPYYWPANCRASVIQDLSKEQEQRRLADIVEFVEKLERVRG